MTILAHPRPIETAPGDGGEIAIAVRTENSTLRYMIGKRVEDGFALPGPYVEIVGWLPADIVLNAFGLAPNLDAIPGVNIPIHQ